MYLDFKFLHLRQFMAYFLLTKESMFLFEMMSIMQRETSTIAHKYKQTILTS